MAFRTEICKVYCLCMVLLLASLPPSCTQQDLCIYPGVQNNGNTLPFKVSFDIGDVASFVCYSPYVVVGSANLTCLGNDMWDAEIPICHKSCTPLTYPDKEIISSNVTLEEVNIVGDVLVWGCRAGYIAPPGQEDDLTVTICEEAGWFTKSIITCNKISCGDPGIPIGVERDGDAFMFLDVVSYTCSQTGYIISNGSPTRTCQSNSTWSGSNPTCILVDCMDPGTHALTKRYGMSFTYLSTLTYECVNGAFLVSGSMTIECQLDGNWSGEPLTCQYVSTEEAIVDKTTTVQTSTGTTTTSGTIYDDVTWTSEPIVNTKNNNEEETPLLSQTVIYAICLIGGSIVFVILTGSAICIFSSGSNRRSKNQPNKTEAVSSVYIRDPDNYKSPTNNANPPKWYDSKKTRDKWESVRSEASYLTPSDVFHDYENIPEAMTRL